MVRIAAVCILVAISTGPGAAEVAVVRPDNGVLTQAALGGARAMADRIERFLRFGGVSARSWPEAELGALTPGRAAVLVVPAGPLSAAGTGAIERYLADGGRVILFAGAEAPALVQRVGVTPGEAVTGPFTTLEFADAAAESAPGLPLRVPQETASARRLELAGGTRSLGEWVAGERRGPAAVTLGPGGAYVNGALGLGQPLAKGWLLHAIVAALDPATAARSVATFRRLASEALQQTASRWAQARSRPGLDRPTVEAIDRDLTRLRQRVAAAPASAATPSLQATTVRQLQQEIVDCQSLGFRMVPSPALELRGVWIHTYAPTDWDAVTEKLARHHFNAIFVRVGRGGNVIYPSALLPRDAWAERAGGDEMQRAVEAAHRHGIAFYAWRVNFHMGSAPRDYYEKLAAEDRLVRGPDGKQAHWANPGDPRNSELEYQAMVEMARNYDVDGIQFDYIRYPDEPHFDFDYGPVSRREFEKSTGKTVARWPQDVLSGPLKSDYEAWERENINDLVERVAVGVRRIRPGVKISAAVWRSHRYWRPILKQDWPRWVERGWLDFVVPMDYTPEQETFAETVEGQVCATRGRAPVMAGIGNWLLFTPEEVVEEVESARASGAGGFVLFAYNAEQIDEHLEALAVGATSRPAVPSDRAPWARLTVTGALEQRDAPLAALAGDALTLRLETGAAAPGRAGAAEVVVESPDGQRLQTLGRVRIDGRGNGGWKFDAPAGRWRPALRSAQQGPDRTAPFVLLGPLVEGLPPEGMAEVRARLAPPTPPREGRPVAIYAYGIGADRIRDALRDAPGITPYLIYSLQPEHLRGAAALVLPQLQDALELSPQAAQRLRAWVQAGGTLVLTHDAVGARWHPRLFPEIGEGAAPGGSKVLEVTARLPGLAEGSRIEPAFADHIPLQLAPAAEVLARESAPSQKPVVARGKLGRGTVVLMGMLLGGGGFEMTGGERALLRAVIAP